MCSALGSVLAMIHLKHDSQSSKEVKVCSHGQIPHYCCFFFSVVYLKYSCVLWLLCIDLDRGPE